MCSATRAASAWRLRRLAAREVLGIDSSRKALELAQANAQLNGLTNVQFEAADSFQWLEARVSAGQQYGGVVLDPPKFAGSRRSVEEALRAYHWVNRLGVELLEPGGILVTCSCSGHVTPEDFLEMLLGVGQQTGRDLQLLEVRVARSSRDDHLPGERISEVRDLPRRLRWSSCV